MPATASQARHKNRATFYMVLILLVATALRLVALGQVPPGLYHDEAYNALDALKVLDGDLSLYFSANNGREPMFIYLIALTVGLLGRSPFAVRLAALAPGLLTIAATYAAARTLFNRRTGLLSAAVLSITLWHVHLSRVGFRAVLLPLFIALIVWQGALGWRTGRPRYWLAAGALYGLSFYTYIAVRFSVVALPLLGAYLVLTRPAWRNRKKWTPLAWSGLTMLITSAPLVLFAILHPDLVLSRSGQVSIWNPEINDGDFLGTLAKHTTRTLGMFFFKGDRIWRHNVPWRPVFDPLLGILFLIGLVWILRNMRKDPAAAFLFIWTATMMLPTLLAEDAPHFLRGVGVLPLAAIFPALGIDWLLQIRRPEFLFTRDVKSVAQYVLFVAIIVILSFGLVSTVTAYFGDYAQAEEAAYWFEDGAVALAGAVNTFLDSGWDGERMRRGVPGDQRVYIEPGLWETWTTVPFLVTETPAVQLLPTGPAWPTATDAPTAIFVWPYGDWQRVWSALSGPEEIRVEEGALSQGDRDPKPYATYRAFYVTPDPIVPAALARFQRGVELSYAEVHPVDQGVRVELRWHATEPLNDDYTIFVHYLRDGVRIAQGDAQPAGGHYPTSRWQAGDLIHDDHLIPLTDPPDPSRDAVILGLYLPDDGQRLHLLDQAGNPGSTFFNLLIDVIETP